MTSIPSLIARVERAEGPDRELDAALYVALIKPDQRPDDLRYFRLPHISMDHMEMCAPGTYWLKQRSGASLLTAPTYTASLDAALALVERVLPGCVWVVGQDWGAILTPRGARASIGYGKIDIADVYAPTPTLALILALLRAMEAQAQEDAR